MNYVHINVNGKEILADKDKSLLSALLENGVYVPNLCFNKDLEVYGGCGLCLVSIEGFGKPARACSITPSEGMRVTTDTPEVVQSRNVSLGLILANHRGDCIAPCKRACPTNQDAQGYIGLIADGKYEEALRLIKEDNPLPSSIGRVCPHPCEEACRRKHAEAPVSICSLKRFAADIDNSDKYIPERKTPTGKRVAIVGAGPAGLSCAYFLARDGHAAEIFEAMDKSGGMLRYGIPAYRLPDGVLEREVAAIEKLGVKINYNKKLGRDISIEALKNEYDAVFIAVGAWKSAALGCENDNLPGVLGGIDFLRGAAQGKRPDIGNRVAVVGGGNTAMDAVRTARRLGANEVTLVYRRTRGEMPASIWEIEEAEEEGVKFMFLVSPDSVIEKNGRAAGLRLQKMELMEPDASGRRRPVPVEGAIEDIPFDTIIAAIGQKVLPDGVEPLEKRRWGTIAADKNSFQTSVAGVFAGGDAINDGPGIAVTAIAHGKHAARAINAYLNDKLFDFTVPFYVEKTPEVSKDIGKVERLDITEDALLSPAGRVKHLGEISRTFTEKEAKTEASRCLECGCNALYDCKLLPLLQSHDVVNVSLGCSDTNLPQDNSHPFIQKDNNKCILCGLCVRACTELAGKEVLGYDERGIATTVDCAFHTPLGESGCNSCGYCTALCPTGALRDKRAFTKSPALPVKAMSFTCEYCENKCSFDIYSYGKSLVRAIPHDLKQSCSIGRYGLTLKGSGTLTDIPEETAEKLIKALLGDLAYFKGDVSQITTIEKLFNRL